MTKNDADFIMTKSENIRSGQADESRAGSVFNIILVSIIAAALLGGVVYTFDRRNTVYNTVTSMNKELSLAEAENVRLQSELESKMSAKNVEEYAENILGMKKMDSSQIKYIKIQTDDVVNIPEREKGIQAKLKGFFDACVEYFRG
ncbi:MAG: cell division protein FtsL [Ruminococcus sp.]|nr:cell division protein FtsL [Ruminococcus sp.]